MPEVRWNGDWNDGAIWYGKNPKRHGGMFYLGVQGPDIESVEIPVDKQKQVARILRRLADRMDPPLNVVEE